MADGAAMVATARPPSSDPAAQAPAIRAEILVNFICLLPFELRIVAVAPVPEFHGSETNDASSDGSIAPSACADGVTHLGRDLCRNFGGIR